MAKSRIKNGIRYTFRTSRAFGGRWYGSVIKSAPHRYAKSSAYGERVRFKAFAFIEVGKFETRPKATEACKQWIEML